MQPASVQDLPHSSQHDLTHRNHSAIPMNNILPQRNPTSRQGQHILQVNLGIMRPSIGRARLSAIMNLVLKSTNC